MKYYFPPPGSVAQIFLENPNKIFVSARQCTWAACARRAPARGAWRWWPSSWSWCARGRPRRTRASSTPGRSSPTTTSTWSGCWRRWRARLRPSWRSLSGHRDTDHNSDHLNARVTTQLKLLSPRLSATSWYETAQQHCKELFKNTLPFVSSWNTKEASYK